MKGRSVASAVLAVSAVLAATTATTAARATAGEPTRPEATIARLPAVVYDAHRGGGLEVRENSLSGLRATYESGTVQVLDLDTRELADGTIVLMHDETVDRVTSGHGVVADYDEERWRSLTLDIGSWLPWQPPPEAPPTLVEVLDQLGGAIVLTVEAKDVDSVDRIAALLRRRGLEDSVFVNTNDPGTARYTHSLGLHSHLWRSAAQMRNDDPRRFTDYVDLVDLDIRADDAHLERFVAAGFPRVWAHTLTTRAERDRARALGITGLVTDDPRYLTGTTDAFPAPPSRVRVERPPRPTQVSDSARTTVAIALESGPSNPSARAEVQGHGVTSATVAREDGVNRLRLRTVGARAGRTRLEVVVPAGHDGERRWTGGTARTTLRLAREDLEVRVAAAVLGRRVHVSTRVLDSAASGYRGPRRETSRPTSAGVERARLRLVVRRPGGAVVHRARVSSVDSGDRRPVVLTDARTAHTWRAPRGGSYVVVVQQRGPTYRTVSARTTVEVD